MKPSRFPIFLLSLTLAAILGLNGQARAEKYTFFAQTQYPLTVYFLKGEQPGPTVMVQGGIQGDESSGFICAQIITKARVLRGNLIVVPRANVPSINVHKRQINVDLNRRFDQDYNKFFEDRLARVIRLLISNSDAFIHLHEGSGFYNPTYVDALRNPKRYGQSVIIDSASFTSPVRGCTVDMAANVNDVLQRLNSEIQRPDYRFSLFNMKTLEPGTMYPEQRKSLTYHAVRDLGIPALAIEVSKNIGDLPWKVAHQLRAVQSFLTHFGVEVSLPELTPADYQGYPDRDAKPHLWVNGQTFDLSRPQTVTLRPHSRLAVSLTESGASSDLFDPVIGVFTSDRPGLNLVTAQRLAEQGFDRIEAKADGVVVGRIKVNWDKSAARPQAAKPGDFICWLNGEAKYVHEGQTITARCGDQLILDGVYGGKKNEVVNLKGYVSEADNGDGQDIGAEIILDPSMFIAKHLLKARKPGETLCEVVRQTRGVKKSRFFLRILPSTVQAVRFERKDGDGQAVEAQAGQCLIVPEGEYAPAEVIGQASRDRVVIVANKQPLPWNSSLRLKSGSRTRITVYQATTFTPLASFELEAASSS